ncbi:phospholipid methyltransferase-domain-containing protein [Zychaea mexicana]|uniref:phospholipid methyltransferase-domain-containing protein n=1 Tax=Zychaea mexicana TaxID=64656 RepID=UPI0022FE70A5|nr:phospholipid methyltransferase-domain-containing protein [Zychaea mexicana]KAI9471424.1 phospholipid methyltransferase-domain-containing protein [Zychaea mexicana]
MFCLTVFRVPATRDMVTALLNPKEKKSFFDLLTLGTMAVEIALLFLLPTWAKQTLFIFIFFFWRLAYNAGLGALLKYQSDSRGLVRMAQKYQIFDQDANPKAYRWLKTQLSMKMGDDYDFASAPIEYNTWLLYRQLVDLILMNDFTSYICFTLAWFNLSPQSTFIFGDALRWAGGLFMILFNIWVKLDAQRVVKDFAWYWGDFFYLIEQSLTFDGVFEMAPHPMYSVGYIGYYGLSLMSASYTVLFVSIAAHALQFAFLVYVETPHIDKTYNPPTLPKRQPTAGGFVSSDEDARDINTTLDKNATRDFYSYYFRRDLIVFKNFDLCRSTDLASAVLMFYSLITPLIIGGEAGVAFAVGQAVFWRIFHSYGLGALLRAQSQNKLFTRHFVKWGGGVEQAFANWKSIYNLSLCMTYITFSVACWEMYSLPSNWTYGLTLLRHTLGLGFISLHIWTAVSIYEVLGDYGWFYGDFFMEDQQTTLLYTGIYRYLNNPEKIVGHAAIWGMTLMANSWAIYVLALFSQISTFLFLNYVEAPHMRKLYGNQIRKEAGLTKTLKSAAIALPNAIPDKFQQEVSKLIRETAELQAAVNTTKNVERIVKEMVEKVEKTAEETAGAVGDMVEAARPRLQEVLEETKTLLETSRSRLIHPLVDNNIGTYDLSRYSVQIKTPSADGFTLGHPIQLSWTAPEKHGERDWIGVYKVTANKHRHITNISSRGLWQWTTAKQGETEGTLVFKGTQLPWKTGTYEFRYHHDGKHNVMARSVAFEITAPKAPSVQDTDAVQRCMLRLIQNVLGNDPERMPVTPVDEYIGMGETEAQYIAYAIKFMYGVEFAWEIVLADKCVARLTKRISHALDALAPFSAVVEEKKHAATNGHAPSSSSTTSSSPSKNPCSPTMMAKVTSDSALY